MKVYNLCFEFSVIYIVMVIYGVYLKTSPMKKIVYVSEFLRLFINNFAVRFMIFIMFVERDVG